jgi:hypothetical protein
MWRARIGGFLTGKCWGGKEQAGGEGEESLNACPFGCWVVYVCMLFGSFTHVFPLFLSLITVSAWKSACPKPCKRATCSSAVERL